MDRMACAWLRRFQLRHHLLAHPEREGLPLVLYSERAGRTRVLCASPEAEAPGIRPGAPVPDARALVPELLAEPGDPQGEAERLHALGETLLDFGPRVMPFPPDALLVEIGGSAHLFGGEAPLLRALSGRLERAGFPARTAIADGALPARFLAARGPRDGLIVPRGESARVLGPLPLRALLPGLERHLDPSGPGGGDPEVFGERFTHAMDLLGVRRVRDLAALPEGAVAERFGPGGLALHRRARAVPEPPLPGLRPVTEIRETLELEGACEGWEPLLFHLKRLLDRVSLRLQARGEAAIRLDLELLHHPDGASDMHLTLARPTRDPKTLHSLLRERLSRVPDGGPITLARVRVTEAERCDGVQRDLVLAAEHRGEDVADLLSRLKAALGDEAVFSPALRPVHRPEAAWVRTPFPGTAPPPGEAVPPLPRPLVLLPAPEGVEWRGEPRGGGGRMTWRGRRHGVASLSPVERLQGEWWADDEGFDGDYRTVTLAGGERVWVRWDRTSAAVHVVGELD